MKKFLYILAILFLFVSVDAANETDIVPHSVMPDSKTGQYRISVNNRHININQLEEGAFLLVFEPSGRNVYKEAVKSSSVSVPVKIRGIYIIRIQTKNSIFTQKILVP